MPQRDLDKTDSSPSIITVSTSYLVILVEGTTKWVPVATNPGYLYASSAWVFNSFDSATTGPDLSADFTL